MPLCSGSDVKLLLGVTTSTDDLLYDTLADAASTAVEKYCGRTFAQSEVTERYTGNGSDKLSLRNRPVLVPVETTDLQVWMDTSYTFGSDTLITYGTDYILDLRGSTTLCESGILVLLRNPTSYGWMNRGGFPSAGGLTLSGRSRPSWGSYPGAIKVTATCGYAVIPTDLAHATASVAVWMANNAAAGGLVQGSQSYIDVSTSVSSAVDGLASGAVPQLGSARMILSRYREIPFSSGL